MDEDEFDTVFEKKNDYLSQYNFRDDSKHKHQLSRFGEDNDKFNEDDDEDEEDEFEDMMNRQMDEVNELQEASKKLTINKTEPRPQTHQIRKAKAVASQTKLYDKVATLRIHLQKVQYTVYSLCFSDYLTNIIITHCIHNFSHSKSHKSCQDQVLMLNLWIMWMVKVKEKTMRIFASLLWFQSLVHRQ